MESDPVFIRRLRSLHILLLLLLAHDYGVILYVLLALARVDCILRGSEVLLTILVIIGQVERGVCHEHVIRCALIQLLILHVAIIRCLWIVLQLVYHI